VGVVGEGLQAGFYEGGEEGQPGRGVGQLLLGQLAEQILEVHELVRILLIALQSIPAKLFPKELVKRVSQHLIGRIDSPEILGAA
jgi:hypothetical protein